MVLSMVWFQVIDNWKHLAIYSLLWSLPNKLERYVTPKLTSLSYFYWEWLLELYCQIEYWVVCITSFLAMLTYAHVLMLQCTGLRPFSLTLTITILNRQANRAYQRAGEISCHWILKSSQVAVPEPLFLSFSSFLLSDELPKADLDVFWQS